jgi:predicted ATPase
MEENPVWRKYCILQATHLSRDIFYFCELSAALISFCSAHEKDKYASVVFLFRTLSTSFTKQNDRATYSMHVTYKQFLVSRLKSLSMQCVYLTPVGVTVEEPIIDE